MIRCIGACVAVVGLCCTTALGFSDNFESYSVGQTPPLPWQVFIQDPGAIPNDPLFHVTDGVPYGWAGNVVHCLDTSPSMGYHLWRTLEAPMSSVVVEYGMLTADSQQPGVFGLLYYGPPAHILGIDFAVAFGTQSEEYYGARAGWIGVWSNRGWEKADLLEYQENTWPGLFTNY